MNQKQFNSGERHERFTESLVHGSDTPCFNNFISKQALKIRFQALTAARMKMTLFRYIAACSLVEVYRCFRGAYCLHHRLDYEGSKYL
jgi:hypothetical protein